MRLFSPAFVLFLITALFTSPGAPNSEQRKEVFPGASWSKAESPEKLGWSSARLAAARAFSHENGSTAVMIVQHGLVVEQWGEVATKSWVHSVRKSLLSALIGIAVDKGQIALSRSLADLGIDDNEPSLTPMEMQATVGDLLKARSGIYHPALAEGVWDSNSKPNRGTHLPGTHWHYNNWDFNALGTIYEQQTSEKIFEAFKRQIADPLQMQDFAVTDGAYAFGEASIHPAYPFRMSARDLARFGLLYLRKGRWRDKQIISRAWITESTALHSDATTRTGYGYMWWTSRMGGFFGDVGVREHSFFARGNFDQFLFVFPYLNLVVVHRVNSGPDGKGPGVRPFRTARLLEMILLARREADIGPVLR